MEMCYALSRKHYGGRRTSDGRLCREFVICNTTRCSSKGPSLHPSRAGTQLSQLSTHLSPVSQTERYNVQDATVVDRLSAAIASSSSIAFVHCTHCPGSLHKLQHKAILRRRSSFFTHLTVTRKADSTPFLHCTPFWPHIGIWRITSEGLLVLFLCCFCCCC